MRKTEWARAMNGWLKKLLISFSLLVLVMLFVIGLKLSEIHGSCFSSPELRKPLHEPLYEPLQEHPSSKERVEHTDCPSTPTRELENVTDPSEHPDMEVRGKWQRKVVANFCHRHGFDNLTGTLPDDHQIRRFFFRHVVFHEPTMALFCFIPKVGCTNMKSSIFVAGGYFSSSFLSETYYDDRGRLEEEIELAIKQGTFQNTSLTDVDRRRMIYQFERYTIVRHPLERLVSAYRSKFRKPVDWHPIPEIVHFEAMKHAALKLCEHRLYSKWKRVGKENVTINFTCYIMWLIKFGSSQSDDHFITLMDNCQPCRMHYHFYGNFKSFSEDGKQILSRFTNDLSSFISEGYYETGKGTLDMLPDYYSQLSYSLKKSLYQHLKLDLEFYHTLYPSELQLTQDLLGLNVSKGNHFS